MARDIRTKAHLQGGEIRTKANFGQTVKVTVSPDPYMGDTEVTPSAETQVLATKKKFVQDDITVLPAPTETLSTTSNGTFTPSDGKVGFSQVDVNVNPDLQPLSVSENGTYQPDGFDGYSEVSVDVPIKTLISESVLAENKTGETVHENYWIENYLPAEQEPDALYVIEFENNNAPNYGVEKLLVGGSRGSGLNGYTGCLIIRRDNGVDMRYVVNFQYLYQNNTRTCAASIGTIIKVYKLRYAF